MVFVPPLDLQTWFITTFAGNLKIAIGILFVLVMGMAAYFRMPTSLTLVSFSLLAIVMGTYFGDIFVLVFAIIALVIGVAVALITKR